MESAGISNNTNNLRYYISDFYVVRSVGNGRRTSPENWGSMKSCRASSGQWKKEPQKDRRGGEKRTTQTANETGNIVIISRRKSPWSKRIGRPDT